MHLRQWSQQEQAWIPRLTKLLKLQSNNSGVCGYCEGSGTAWVLCCDKNTWSKQEINHLRWWLLLQLGQGWRWRQVTEVKSRPRLTAGGMTGEYEMWSGDETGLGASRGCSGSFFFSIMTGCWAAGSCFPVRSGSVAGHGQLRLWALCSLVEQHCSTGGDSQAYQVKKKCLATEGFSCRARVCVCVCGGWWWKSEVGWDQGDGVSKLQSENFPASEETLKSHPRSDFHKHPQCSCSLFHKTCWDIFGFCPKFTDVLEFFYFFIWPAHLVIIWKPRSCAYVCLSVFFPWRCTALPLVQAQCQLLRFHSACVCFSDWLGRNQ